MARPAAAAHLETGTRNKKGEHVFAFSGLAEWTGLEPATPGVTGRYSNQLNYHSPKAAVFDFGGC
jgi:hypothetical protein